MGILYVADNSIIDKKPVKTSTGERIVFYEPTANEKREAKKAFGLSKREFVNLLNAFGGRVGVYTKYETQFTDDYQCVYLTAKNAKKAYAGLYDHIISHIAETNKNVPIYFTDFGGDTTPPLYKELSDEYSNDFYVILHNNANEKMLNLKALAKLADKANTFFYYTDQNRYYKACLPNAVEYAPAMPYNNDFYSTIKDEVLCIPIQDALYKMVFKIRYMKNFRSAFETYNDYINTVLNHLKHFIEPLYAFEGVDSVASIEEFKARIDNAIELNVSATTQMQKMYEKHIKQFYEKEPSWHHIDKNARDAYGFNGSALSNAAAIRKLKETALMDDINVFLENYLRILDMALIETGFYDEFQKILDETIKENKKLKDFEALCALLKTTDAKLKENGIIENYMTAYLSGVPIEDLL